MFNVLKITSGDKEYNVVPRDDTLHQVFFGLQNVNKATIVPDEYSKYVSTLLYNSAPKFYTCSINVTDDADAFIGKDVPYVILCVQARYYYSGNHETCNHYIRLDFTEETSVGTGYFGMYRYCEMFPFSGGTKLSDSLMQVKITFNDINTLYVEMYTGLSNNSEVTDLQIDGVSALYIPNLGVQKV